MSHCAVARRLRPLLSARFRQLQPATTRHRESANRYSSSHPKSSARDSFNSYESRVQQLEAHTPSGLWYPRIVDAAPGASGFTSIKDVREGYSYLEQKQTKEDVTLTVAGRVKSVRLAGSSLVFIDLEEDSQHRLQVVCNFARVGSSADIDKSAFKSRTRMLNRGDACCVQGSPHRTEKGELSIMAASLPVLLSPALHPIPEQLEDAETRAHLRYVDMQVNPAAIGTLRVRHLVEQQLHGFLSNRGFTSVKTPILDDDVGGAVARPFKTEATEFPDQSLHLRIAPELWLKRLVVGGMDRVYEIGPAFRNEGVDATHNPEFHICEFYQAYATLDDLMLLTEQLLYSLAERIRSQSNLSALDIPALSFFDHPYPRLEFIPTIEKQLGHALPDLSSPTATDDLRSVFTKHSIPIPSDPTLPRLLDALCSHVVEPLTHERPTYIINHPAALSPLSKHFICPVTKQTVAARAELFIKGREYANMYEEENSPFAQRANFEAQARYRQQSISSPASASSNSSDGDDGLEAGHSIDEPFLHALEWGLPPTGGWGCGIDRLVMLFAGRERIADVLAFGTLRHVVGLGKRTVKKSQQGSG